MLEDKSKLYKHPKARTLYVTIPATVACDSQFPFKAGMKVNVSYNSKLKQIEIVEVKKHE